MKHEHDPFEEELSALRPVEPSEGLAKKIGGRLEADGTAPGRPSPGRRPTLRVGARATLSRRERVWRRAAAAIWITAGAIALVALVATVFWRGRERTPEVEVPLAAAEPRLAFDDSLPSVWSYRPALASADALETLLDKHARLAPPPGDNVQTRGFGAVTMNQNSQLGGF